MKDWKKYIAVLLVLCLAVVGVACAPEELTVVGSSSSDVVSLAPSGSTSGTGGNAATSAGDEDGPALDDPFGDIEDPAVTTTASSADEKDPQGTSGTGTTAPGPDGTQGTEPEEEVSTLPGITEATQGERETTTPQEPHEWTPWY